MDFVSYLDTLNYEKGDTPSLHMSWFRAGNHRRKTITKNGNSFLKIDCSVSIKKPEKPKSIKYSKEYYLDSNSLFQEFRATGEDIVKALSDIRSEIENYIDKTYGA